MAAQTFDEFMAKYNHDGSHEVIAVDAIRDGREASPFIVVRCGHHAVVINPLAFEDHLCIDLHSFIDGRTAAAGVFGMTAGRRVQFPDTGETSHGWPATRLVSVLVGEQASHSGYNDDPDPAGNYQDGPCGDR